MKNKKIIDVISKYLNLTQEGNKYKALCPFHTEKTPSFYITPDMNAFHCFGCGAHGNLNKLLNEFLTVDEIEKIDFEQFDVYKKTAEGLRDFDFNNILENLGDIIPDLSLIEQELYTINNKIMNNYLSNRRINPKIAEEYGLKTINYGSEGIFIPVYFKHNNKIKITEAQVRFVSDNVKPKIKGIPGSRKIFFFGFYNKEDLNINKDTERLLITESWGNTLSYVSNSGNRDIIGAMGSHVTEKQLEYLRIEVLRLPKLKELIIIPDVGKYDTWVTESIKLGKALNINTYIFNIKKALEELDYKEYSENPNKDYDLNDILKKFKDIKINDIIEEYKEQVWKNKQDFILTCIKNNNLKPKKSKLKVMF